MAWTLLYRARKTDSEEFRSSGVQEFRSSGVQEFRSSGRFKSKKGAAKSRFSRKTTAPDSATPELL
jgi:hypothetical protein